MEALFQHRNTDSGVAIAALVPSPSALFIQAASAPADLAGEDVELGAGPVPDSRFFASTGRYSTVHAATGNPSPEGVKSAAHGSAISSADGIRIDD